ncbi:MAG: hypothetical protein M3N51_04840, partial [Actinomycetota bacterium]|nr:hypothetical protein [Actinomycetota bacterium]
TLRRARRAVGQLLLTLKSSFIEANPQPPPGPTLEGLRRLGAPTVPDSEFVAAVDRLVDRRRLLLAFVKSDGWDWQDAVVAPRGDSLLLLEPSREAPEEA